MGSAVLVTKTVLLVACVPAASQVAEIASSTDMPGRYAVVLALRPVGYWPADEGAGDVLRDRSGSGNDGLLINTPWRDGLLEFTNDFFQWAQIPHHQSYRSRSFTIGCWVFSRRVYKTSRALLIGQPWVPRNSGLRWTGWYGTQEGDGVILRYGAASEDPERALIEVVSSSTPDALGSAADGVDMATDEWQHLLYAYDGAGTGSLYLNGQLAQTTSEVPFKPAETPLVIGGDLELWGVWPIDGRSLDGSVRDIVVFDRALTPEEVDGLYEATTPPAPPSGSADDSRAVGGEATAPQGLPALVRTLRAKDTSRHARAEAALALAAMGPDAASAVPTLVEALETILDREGAGLPRIEDIARNAVMRALLDIDLQDERARDVLGRALAKPIFDSLDMTKGYLADARALVEAGRPMDALDVHRAHLQALPELPGQRYWGYSCPDDVRVHLPLREEYFDAYLSKGDPFSDGPYTAKGCRPADYTPIDVHDGSIYMTVVERISQEEVEREYEAALSELTTDRPAADAKWSRVKILKIDAEGNEQEVSLEGEWFMFNAKDAKMDGWAIGVDSDGYIHVVGGQHNSPVQDNYVPGVWEKMGISQRDNRPAVMYWVSTEPGDVESLAFVGQPDNPRSIPCGWMNYMNFARSHAGDLLLYGRDHIWSWGLYRYDAETRRWSGSGGSAVAMLDHAKDAVPDWAECLETMVPYFGPTPHPALVAAYQPGAYNFNRDSWGVRFDRTGRMHVRMGIWGVGEAGRMTNGPVYAYSDDLGATFHRADGTRLELPLTVNPIPGHHADVAFHSTRRWFDLWVSLIEHAGYSAP